MIKPLTTGCMKEKSSTFSMMPDIIPTVTMDASNGINLKVIRDKNGNIEKLVETEAQELEQYVK